MSRYSSTGDAAEPLPGDHGEPVDHPVPEITVESDGVTLTKFTTVTEDELRLAYVLSSSRDDPVRVRITEPRFGKSAAVSTDAPVTDTRESEPLSTDGRTDGGESATRDGPVNDTGITTDRDVTVDRGVAIDRVVESDGLVRIRKRFPVYDAPLPEFIPDLTVDAAARTGTSSSASSTVLVGVPAYNESGTIADVVSDVKQYADNVLVVDDGSDDDTASAARAAGASILSHATNQGYGASLQSIFRVAARADVDCLVVIDGDGQHDVDDVPELVATQHERDADVVIGSRFVDDDGSEDVPLYRRFGIGVINLLVNVTTNGFRRDDWMSDSQSGFRAYSRTAIHSIAADDSIGAHMGASTDILHHVNRRGFDVVEIPTTISYDVENANSQSPVRHGTQIVWSVLTRAVRDSPRRYAASGIASTVCGVALAALALSTGGGSTLASALALAGLLVVALGLASVGVAVRIGRPPTPE